MSELLKELSKQGIPSDFQKETSKSALHLLFQSNNKGLINLDSLIEFDGLLEKNEDEKLSTAERIFSNVENNETVEEAEDENNKEEIYL